MLARSTPFSSTPPPSKEPLLWVTEALPPIVGGSGRGLVLCHTRFQHLWDWALEGKEAEI